MEEKKQAADRQSRFQLNLVLTSRLFLFLLFFFFFLGECFSVWMEGWMNEWMDEMCGVCVSMGDRVKVDAVDDDRGK